MVDWVALLAGDWFVTVDMYQGQIECVIFPFIGSTATTVLCYRMEWVSCLDYLNGVGYGMLDNLPMFSNFYFKIAIYQLKSR